MSKGPGGYGGADLYISFAEENSLWTTPQNMGAAINTATDDFGPYVTDDNKYLFYASGYNSPSSIYWIRIDEMIDSLRNTSVPASIHFSTKNKGLCEIYPNPVKNQLSIDFNNEIQKEVIIEIVSLNGRLIQSFKFDNISQTSINITNEIKGIYLIKIISGSIITTRQIYIE
jgi:hypothetical protein